MRDILILLRIELKRLFKSKLFYVSLFIGLALSVGGFIECAKPHLNITNGFNGGVETYPFSVFNSWMGMFMGLKPISTSYLYIFMLLAALPYCGFFCRDNKNQYILQYYSRMSKNKIHAARFIATFISGGLVTMLPLLLNLCLFVFHSLLYLFHSERTTVFLRKCSLLFYQSRFLFSRKYLCKYLPFYFHPC